MKNQKFRWYKYREHTSSSLGEWRYIVLSARFLNHPKEIAEILDNRGLLCTWSEHFRRVEVKPAYKIPKQVLENEIKDTEFTLKENSDVLQWLKKLNNP